MYFLGYITFTHSQNGIEHQRHIDAYYDETTNKKVYRSYLQGQIRMVEKNQLDFKANVVINTFPLHGSNSNCFAFMITSDIHKALQAGVDRQNVFNSIVDFRRHIDEWFGQTTISKMQQYLERNINAAINNKLDSFQARMVALQRQVELQEKEIAFLKNELQDIKQPKKVDVSCCDLLSLEEETTACNRSNGVIEY